MLRLDYFSPLPPVRSGISDYSVDLLTELVSLADVRVVPVEGQPVDDDVASRFGVSEDTARSEPGDGQPGGEESAGGRVPLYQVGNNPHHAEIYERALRTPGIVVLHDVFLHHLLTERTLGKASIDGYLALVRQEAGWQGLACGLPPRWSAYAQSHLFSIPAHRRLLERQQGIVVHSEWARRRIREEGVNTPVEVVPMPMPCPVVDADLKEAASRYRARLGLDEATLLVGSFGFQTPIKRTREVVRALAEPGVETVHLLVAGELSPQLELEELVEELGLSDRVHLVGYLPSADFLSALLACDLGVNLRYPSAGETSASLLRILAMGRSAVVSDYAQFGELSDDIVFKVPVSPLLPEGYSGRVAESESPSAEVRALAEVLADLSGNRDRILEMGQQACTFVGEHHQPKACAERLVAACERLIEDASRKAPVASEDRPKRPTSLTWGRLDAVVEVAGTADWRPGERRCIEVTLRNVGFARWRRGDAGPGGVAVAVELWDVNRDLDLRSGEPWLSLPRDLDPGEHVTLKLSLRRPLGAAELRVSPHVLGGRSFERGGPLWQQAV